MSGSGLLAGGASTGTITDAPAAFSASMTGEIRPVSHRLAPALSPVVSTSRIRSLAVTGCWRCRKS